MLVKTIFTFLSNALAGSSLSKVTKQKFLGSLFIRCYCCRQLYLTNANYVPHLHEHFEVKIENHVSENYIYLFEQCISRLFLVKSDKAKVFGFAVIAAVNRPLYFNNLTVPY